MDHPEPSLPPQPPPRQSATPVPTASDIEAAMSWAHMPGDESTEVPGATPAPAHQVPQAPPALGGPQPQAPGAQAPGAPQVHPAAPLPAQPMHPSQPPQQAHPAPWAHEPAAPAQHHVAPSPHPGPHPGPHAGPHPDAHAVPHPAGAGSTAPYPMPPQPVGQPYPAQPPVAPQAAPVQPAAALYVAPGEAPQQMPLSSIVLHSDPRNPEHQTVLLQRIRELSAGLSPEAGELVASLDMASTLTQYLVRMGGLGPEDVLQIVSRLVADVELRQFAPPPPTAAPAAPAQEEAPAWKPRKVVLDASHVEGALRMAGARSSDGLLGELMIQMGFCTRAQVDQALRSQHGAGCLLGDALVQNGAATWKQVKQAVEAQRQLRK